ncbi:primosomal protein N' [Candidatus Saccharibacteria bacterium]|nr:MAG: primosomal protein N' [Candidatus Saccharibacteria bacterium]
MHYYHIWVATPAYHKPEPLTYSHDAVLKPGAAVVVPLRGNKVVGTVAAKTTKPRFATKPIVRALDDCQLPPSSQALADWLADYYPAPSGILWQLFLPSGLVQQPRTTSAAADDDKARGAAPAAALPSLTSDQQSAIQTINASTSRSIILHGDTGTGKTRVYIELAAACLERQKSAIIMTPEISLTPQLVAAFEQAFPDRTVVMHSHLSIATKRRNWLDIARADQPLIVIGPRSALFAPLNNIGLIVQDECHDGAYKQEQAPYYQTSRVAAKLAAIHDAALIMGSATPSVSDYYMFEHKKLPIVRMRQMAVGREHPAETKVVDLRDRQQFARSRWLSDMLLDRIADALRQNRQSLVFLNRRGTARLVLCEDCGWQMLCPQCDLPLTYHGDQHSTQCHTCGFAATPPAHCEQCNSGNILFRGLGTKSLYNELQKLFPQARISRFDSDNAQEERLEKLYSQVRSGQTDIIVGTQQLSKGLDLPQLRVVGVVLADTGLYFPDFTAEERTYQMLRQVMGRVGRGHGLSNIIVQTYQPDSSVIGAALDKDYAAFYQSQIAERQQFNFPPLCYVLKLSCARASSAVAERAAVDLAAELRQRPSVQVTEPAPSFTAKVRGKYRWQLIVRSQQRARLTAIVRALPSGWGYDIDPTDLL